MIYVGSQYVQHNAVFRSTAGRATDNEVALSCCWHGSGVIELVNLTTRLAILASKVRQQRLPGTFTIRLRGRGWRVINDGRAQ